jgi:hypothetical protein
MRPLLTLGAAAFKSPAVRAAALSTAKVIGKAAMRAKNALVEASKTPLGAANMGMNAYGAKEVASEIAQGDLKGAATDGILSFGLGSGLKGYKALKNLKR